MSTSPCKVETATHCMPCDVGLESLLKASYLVCGHPGSL